MYIPHVYNARNRTFFFCDYQKLIAINGGSLFQTTVPTSLMQSSSNFTDLNELITYGAGTNTDALGRVFPTGTILDPATTRAIAAGATDSITGLTNTSSGTVSVRDPFYSGGSGRD